VHHPGAVSFTPESGLGDEERWRAREWVWVTAAACGFTAAYALISLFRHWRFGSGYDLGIFDQAVWLMSRFEAPASTISGYAHIFGDHFSPVLILLAPLYWVAPAPETLLIV
jgi:uncharacterized membrane protein